MLLMVRSSLQSLGKSTRSTRMPRKIVSRCTGSIRICVHEVSFALPPQWLSLVQFEPCSSPGGAQRPAWRRRQKRRADRARTGTFRPGSAQLGVVEFCFREGGVL